MECLASGPRAIHPRRRGERMPKRHMLLHPLPPGVKCPACGGGLTFIRVRVFGDLYQCKCKHQVMHYLNTDTKTCGYAIIRPHGRLARGPRAMCPRRRRNECRNVTCGFSTASDLCRSLLGIAVAALGISRRPRLCLWGFLMRTSMVGRKRWCGT